jgi:hypothetical protein
MTIALPIAAAIIRDITERRIAEAGDPRPRAERRRNRRRGAEPAPPPAKD